MKKLLYLSLILACQASLAQSTAGISFPTAKTWADVLTQAKTENKLVFVDVATSWCGPCKAMEKEVFPLAPVGKAYNAAFVNYKLDAEKGEGIALAKKYAVHSYPTYLFVNGDGTLIYRANGSMSPREFLQVSKNALAEAKQSETIVQLQDQYPAHKTDTAFMFHYLTRLTALKLPTDTLLDQYAGLLTPQQQADPKNVKLIADNGAWLNKQLKLGPAFDVLKRNKAVLDDLVNKKIVDDDQTLPSIQSNVLDVSLRKAIETRNKKLFEQVVAMKPDFRTEPFNNKQTISLEYYQGIKDFKKYELTAARFLNDFLLKIPADTLDKWDQNVFMVEKAHLGKENNPKHNNAEYLNTYKHTQTIQVARALSDASEKMMDMPLTHADLINMEKWSSRAVAIAATDPVSYGESYPAYKKVLAMVMYKAGKKQAAIKMMQQLIDQFAAIPQAKEYFTNAMNKMLALTPLPAVKPRQKALTVRQG